MSHQKLWLSAACILFLVGCASNSSSGSSLKAPVLELNESRDGLVWEPVEGATSYEITIDEETTTTDLPAYSFTSEYGEYVVSVVAVNEKGGKSKAAVFEYETRITRLGSLGCDGYEITWYGSDYYALETSRDGVEYTPIEGYSLSVEESGFYYFRTVKGFKDEGHLYYGTEINKCLIVTVGSPSPYIIEDGTEIDNATLSEQYKKYKYSSGWETSAAYVTLDDTSKKFITENCVDFHSWHQGVFFMFEKQIKIPGSFNEFDFSVKSSTAGVKVVLSLQIAHTMVINGIDLNGVYIKYAFDAPTAWYRNRISLNDSKWKVNYGGGEYDFSTIASMINGAGIVVQSLSDMLPYFDLFQFRIQASYNSTGTSTHTYFDDVVFCNSDLAASESELIIPPLSVEKNYAFAADNAKGNAAFYSEDHVMFRFTTPNSMNVDAAYTIEDEVLTITSTESGKDFVATFTSADGGLSLNLQNITGSLANDMKNLMVEAIVCLEDFESYTETGIGYDNAHTEEERTGLRGAYLCDQYTGNNSHISPIGGKGWSLMDEDDYLYLETTEVHTGEKSAKLKSFGMTTRYMTYGLHDGTGEGVRGKTFSFWAKGGSNSDVTIRANVYFVPIVNSSNHSDSGSKSSKDIVIPKDSGWAEYTITLDTGRFYYGFSLNCLSIKAERQEVFVDDIYIYNNMSPWAA